MSKRYGHVQMKKKWVKPELVILVRNKPEEALLLACKGDGSHGPNNDNVWCEINGLPHCGPVCATFATS